MADEKRTLQIQAKVQDQASSAFQKIGLAAKSSAGAIVAGFRGAVGALTSLQATFVGLLGVVGAGRLIGAFEEVAKGLDAIAKQSDNLGVTAESLTAIRNGAELAGVSMEDLGTAVKHFETAVGKANDGGKEQRQLLAQLGIAAEQFTGQQIDLVDLLGRVADGLGGVGSAADQTRILVDLFGKSGSNLKALLAGGSAGIRQLADEARAAGGVFSREELKRVEDFNDAVTSLHQAFRQIAERLLVDVAPALTNLFKQLRQLVEANSQQIREGFLDLLVLLVDGFRSLSFLVDLLRESFKGLQSIVQSFTVATNALFGSAQEYEQSVARLRKTRDEIVELEASGAKASKAFDDLSAAIKKARADAGRIPTGAPVTVEGTAPKATDPKEISAIDRMGDGIRKASESWRDFNQAAFDAGQTLVNGPLNALTDALAAGIAHTKSWKTAFQDFGRQTLQILAQVIAKLIVVRTLQAIFGGPAASASGAAGASAGATAGFATGGVMRGGVQSLLPLRRFAMGGVVNQPTLALVGEGKAPGEAFVPLPDGKRIPVAFAGGGGGNHTVVQVSIQALDGADVARVLTKNRNLLRQFVVDDMDRRVSVRQAHRRAVG